jgi:hypothetical protein
MASFSWPPTKAVSDEALIDLDDYTLMLIAKRK